VQRTVAHAVVTDAAGRTLVTRTPAQTHWTLPGATVAHGEHPLDAARRGLTARTGLKGGPGAARAALSDVVETPELRLHTLRLVFDLTIEGEAGATPETPAEVGYAETSGGACAWPLAPVAAEVLGVAAEVPGVAAQVLGVAAEVPGVAAGPALRVDPPLEPQLPPEPGRPVKVQRPGAYAVIVDAGRILLARMAGTEQLWTLPGGGIDFGEPPLLALKREMYEETGLDYTAGPLLRIGSRHFTGRAPDGRLEDFQGLRLIYAGAVPLDEAPRVTEIDGSTAEAAWVSVADLDRLHISQTVHDALAALADQHRDQHRDRQG
jgi:8-oxo-dGTP diphosphatase